MDMKKVVATAASGAPAAALGAPAALSAGFSAVVTMWASGVVIGLHGGAQLAFRVTDFSPGALVWAYS